MKPLTPILILAALTAAPALPAAPASRISLQKQNFALIQRLQDSARDIADTAERLDSYNRVPDQYSRECHFTQLDSLKEGINHMTTALERLSATQNGMDDADRKAVTRVLIAAVELAQSANSAILKANTTEDTPGLSLEYRKLMSDCYRQSAALVKALDAAAIELK